jgi:hypothetical protein
MTRNLLTMLDYEAKRQPRLATLVADIDRLSEADIQAAPVRLPWMRQALLALKASHNQAALIAWVEQRATAGRTADPIGEMRRWEAGDSFVRVGRSHLEVRHGQLLWFDGSGVWIDTIRTSVIDPQLQRQSVACGRVTRSEYLAAIRARARQLLPDAPQSTERVRFYRPG